MSRLTAVDLFFKDADKLDHRTRAAAYARAMEQVYQRYPQDREAAIFYALALQATSDPHDKAYATQRRSSEIAEKVLAAEPNHPGAAHYIPHAYYGRLLTVAASSDGRRPEVGEARAFVGR